MGKNRQLRDSKERGEFLAGWLNREGRLQAEVAHLLRFLGNRQGFNWDAVRALTSSFSVSTSISNGRILFSPHDERGIVLMALRDLQAADALGRLKECACRRWFFARSLKRRWCSPGCRSLAWSKTGQGRRTRGLYMRRYRAIQRRLWEAKQKGRSLKRGRKIHHDLRKGE